MFCEQCGAELEPDSRFCDECGSRVSDGDTVFPARQRRSFWAKGLIAAFLVALVFGSVLWLVFRPARAGLVDVARVLPANTAALISFRDPVTHWETIEKSNFYKTVQATEAWREVVRELRTDRGFQTFQASLDQIGASKVILKGVDDLVSLGIVVNPLSPHQGPAPLLIMQGTAALQLAERGGILRRVIEARGYAVRVERTGGAEMHSVLLGRGEELHYAFARNFMLVSPRKDLLREAIARLQGERGETLAGTSSFRRSLGLRPGPQAIFVYLNGPFLLPIVKEEVCKAVPNQCEAALSDMQTLQSVAVNISFDQGLVIRSRALVDKTRLLEKGIPVNLQHSITGTSLALLPAEALGYLLVSGAYFTDYLPQMYREQINKASVELGVDLRRELLSQVGHEVTIALFEPDPDLPFPIPGFVLAVEAKREEESLQAFEAVIIKVTDELRRGGLIGMQEETDYRGTRIVFYRGPAGISLVYSHVGDFLVLGTGVNVLKKVIDVAKGSGDNLLQVFKKDPRLREYVEEKNSELVEYFNFQGFLDSLVRLANRPEVRRLIRQDRAKVEKVLALIESLRVLQYSVGRSWMEDGVREGSGYVAMRDLEPR